MSAVDCLREIARQYRGRHHFQYTRGTLRVRGVLCGISLAASVVTFTSCKQNLDLTDVTALAKTVATSQDALLAVPQDFYDSCVRQIGWSRGAAIYPTTASVTVGAITESLPQNQRTLLGKAPPHAFSAPLESIFDVTTACVKFNDDSEQMTAVTTAITSYFEAIGKLAATGTTAGVGFDKLGVAATSLDPTSRFNKSGKTAAVASGLDTLASGIIAARAKTELGPDIITADALIGKLIDRLINDKAGSEDDNAAAYYLTQLSYERFAMHSFYENNIGASTVGIARLQAFDYYSKEAAEDAKIDERVAAVQIYKSTLNKIRSAHADLAKAVATNDLASAVKLAQQYDALLKPQLEKLRKAFH